jgi:hypothetical protein
MDANPRYADAVRRAALPEILFAPDLAIATGLPEPEADVAARTGRFGPQLFIKGRVAVLRQDFLAYLTQHAKARDAARKEVLP